MNRPVGGRGKKAPYKTVVKRIPQPIEEKVEALIDNYINQSDVSLAIKIDTSIIEDSGLSVTTITKDEMIDLIKSILKSKMSAKKSLIKLLQLLYKSQITDEDIANL